MGNWNSIDHLPDDLSKTVDKLQFPLRRINQDKSYTITIDRNSDQVTISSWISGTANYASWSFSNKQLIMMKTYIKCKKDEWKFADHTEDVIHIYTIDAVDTIIKLLHP